MSGSPRRRLRGWVAVAALVLLAAGLFVFWSDRFIFYPSREGDWEARRRASVPVDEVWLTTADGTRLYNWYSRPADPRAIVLVFHGNAGNLSDRLQLLEALAGIRAAAFLVGYHGYGRSEGAPSEQGFYQDADAAYGWLTTVEKVPPARVVAYGESLGAAAAIDLAARVPVGGLVVQSGFTSIRDMAAAVVPLVPVHLLIRSKLDNRAKIPSVKAPSLFFAAREDEVVPYAQTRRLHESCRARKRWVEFSGCGHNDLFATHRQEWIRAFDAFLTDPPVDQ